MTNLLFQGTISIKRLYLCEGDWLTSDVNLILSYLSSRQLDCLGVLGTCKLNYKCPVTCILPEPLHVQEVQIEIAMTLDALVGLLSNMIITELVFTNGAAWLERTNYTYPSLVSYDMTYFIYSHLIILNMLVCDFMTE